MPILPIFNAAKAINFSANVCRKKYHSPKFGSID